VVPARQKAWFAREAVRLERRRLVVWEENGEIFVENHLGSALSGLVVNFKGKQAIIGDLPVGAKKSSAPAAAGQAASRVSEIRAKLLESGGNTILRASYPLQGLVADLFSRSGAVPPAMQGAFIAAIQEGAREDVWLDSFRTAGLSA